jgi:hypothetical protein
VSLEWGALSLLRINEGLIERKAAAPVCKTEINYRGGSEVLITQHPYIRKFGNKFRLQVAVAQSVYFACGLKAKEYVLFGDCNFFIFR